VRSCCVCCRRWQLVIHLPHATCLLRTAKKMKCYTTSLSHGSVGRRGQRPRTHTHTHKSIGLFGIWGLSPFAMSSNVMKRTDSKREKEKNKYEKRKRERERERGREQCLDTLRFTFITKHILYASKVSFLTLVYTYLVNKHIFFICQLSCSNRKAFKLLPWGPTTDRERERERKPANAN